MTPDEIDVNEIIDELDALGKALFDAAVLRIRLKKAYEQLERQQEGGADGDPLRRSR